MRARHIIPRMPPQMEDSPQVLAERKFLDRIDENGMILAERAQHMLPNWLRKTWVLCNAPFRYYEWK